MLSLLPFRKCVLFASSVAVIFLFVARPRLAIGEDFCYMDTQSGGRINLDHLCGAGRSSSSRVTVGSAVSTPTGAKLRTVFRDGRPIGVEVLKPDGSALNPGETLELPSRVLPQPGRSATTSFGEPSTGPDGIRFRPVRQDGVRVGIQLLRHDGSALRPGEVLQLPDGRTLQQERFR